jgi:hypothetical protein
MDDAPRRSHGKSVEYREAILAPMTFGLVILVALVGGFYFWLAQNGFRFCERGNSDRWVPRNPRMRRSSDPTWS